MIRSAAVGFGAGVAVAGFGHPTTVGRQALFYGRNMHCYRRPATGGIVAVGDSITEGTSWVAQGMLGKQSWFSHALTQGKLPYSFNGAAANQSTEWIALRSREMLTRYQPSVLAVLAGVNDVVLGNDPARPVQLIGQIIARARASDVVPVVGTLPPLNPMAAGAFEVTDGAVERFNEMLSALASSQGVKIMDFYAAVAVRGKYAPGTSDDGLHPNKTGSALMGRAAVRPLQDAVAQAMVRRQGSQTFR